MSKDTYQSIRRLRFLFSWLSKELGFLTRENKILLLNLKDFQTKTKENNVNQTIINRNLMINKKLRITFVMFKLLEFMEK